MSAAIAEADPEGVLYMSGWFLAAGADWTPDVCRTFFDAMDSDRYFVCDSWADYRATYPKTNYFGGGDAEWVFGVLHTFGNVERPHGNLADLITRVKTVVADPNAKNCNGLYIVPESFHHNFLYYDLATEMAWDPRPVELGDFLKRYCTRRYGAESADAMVKAWQLVAQTVYSDNIEPNPTPTYQGPFPQKPGGVPGFTKHTDRRISYIPLLRQALEAALVPKDQLKDNPHYQRDIVDIGCSLLGSVFDKHALSIHQAFAAGDVETIKREKVAGLKALDAIAELIATRSEFFIEEEMKLGRKLPTRTYNHDYTVSDNIREVRQRFTAMAGMEAYPSLLDYAAADRVEVVRYFYRPRFEAWIDHMLKKIGGEVDFGHLIHGPYKDIAQDFTDGKYETPKNIPSGKKASDVATSLLVSFETQK